jgi:8-oxo-dGTP pyrophosphatase MutT (NUDIX family)
MAENNFTARMSAMSLIEPPLSPSDDHLQAAGGVLVRTEGNAPLIAVIYRSRYKEWALPKGKLEPGEGPLQAALREVREETGFDASPIRFLGKTSYSFGSKPKTVLFWIMRPEGPSGFTPSEEVERVEWLPIEEAIQRLDHDEERALVRRLREDYGAGSADAP